MSDNFFKRRMIHTATLWESSGVDSAGDDTWGSPRQISVRWEDSSEKFFNNGEEEEAKAKVYVGEDLIVGDFLFFGTSATADPTGLIGAYQIKRWVKTPTVAGRQFVREALL